MEVGWKYLLGDNVAAVVILYNLFLAHLYNCVDTFSLLLIYVPLDIDQCWKVLGEALVRNN